MRVLVVEDDPRMGDLLRQSLEEEGYAVCVAANGEEGFAIARDYPFEAIVLDWMLPGLSGMEVCRRLRRAGRQTPILMLTARDQTTDVVAGLDGGADDYLTKPFALDVLLARLRAVSRRGPIPRPVILRAGPVELDAGSREARVSGRKVELTKTEYALLELLVRNAGRVVPREEILSQVWGHGASIESNTLDAFVSLLRRKLEAGGSARLVHTIRGLGYRLGGERPC